MGGLAPVLLVLWKPEQGGSQLTRMCGTRMLRRQHSSPVYYSCPMSEGFCTNATSLPMVGFNLAFTLHLP